MGADRKAFIQQVRRQSFSGISIGHYYPRRFLPLLAAINQDGAA